MRDESNVVWLLLVVLVGYLALVAILTATSDGAAPAHAVTAPCKIVRVIDGDTVEVEITRRAKVRLLGCWAPELREPGGLASKQHLARLAEGKEATLHVPMGTEISKSWSFGRLLGRLWIVGDPKTLGQHQVTAGHASSTKRGELGE